jgi:formamidopyrimidine-DNA glycosylase
LDKVAKKKNVPDEKHSNLWLTVSSEKKPSLRETEDIYAQADFFLFYTDSRHFGEFKICLDEDEFIDVMKKVGKDLLKDEITEEYFISVCRMKKHLNKPICEVLMNQEYVAGIGNYVRAEVLYDSQINPWRTVDDLSDEELSRILQSALKICKAAYDKGGASLKTYKDFDGQKGSYVVQVYGKKDDKNVSSKYDKQKRMVWWHSSQK